MTSANHAPNPMPVSLRFLFGLSVVWGWLNRSADASYGLGRPVGDQG